MRSYLIYHVWDSHLNDEPFIVRLCIVVNRPGENSAEIEIQIDGRAFNERDAGDRETLNAQTLMIETLKAQTCCSFYIRISV